MPMERHQPAVDIPQGRTCVMIGMLNHLTPIPKRDEIAAPSLRSSGVQ